MQAQERPAAPSLREMPEGERPIEKLWFYGPEALQTRELIALMLHTGTRSVSVLSLADQLLARFGSLEGLAEASPVELTGVRGVGKAKAARLAAACEIGRRSGRLGAQERPQIRSARDVADLVLNEMRALDREEFRAILLDNRNRVIGIRVISIGHLSAVLVHPRELFKECIRKSCASVVLVHNHPSGDPEPSVDDLRMTQRLREAGKLLGIEVLDHIIVGGTRFVSMRERGAWEPRRGGEGTAADAWEISDRSGG